MKSTALSVDAIEHIKQLTYLASKEDTKDLLKYALINSERFNELGIASGAIRIVVSRVLEIEIPNYESEDN